MIKIYPINYIASKFQTMRRTLLPLFAVLFYSVPLRAQFYKSVLPSAAFSDNLSAITQAFSNNFYKIQGPQLPSQEDMDIYQSTVTLPGAKHCVIYRFHSKIDSSASWQGIIYSGDNYKDALKTYKNTCRQVEGTRVKLDNDTYTTFIGKTYIPDTELRFVSSTFNLNKKDAVYDHFYAEVELVNLTFDQWEVHINLQNKKDDEDK